MKIQIIMFCMLIILSIVGCSNNPTSSDKPTSESKINTFIELEDYYTNEKLNLFSLDSIRSDTFTNIIRVRNIYRILDSSGINYRYYTEAQITFIINIDNSCTASEFYTKYTTIFYNGYWMKQSVLAKKNLR